MKHFIPLLCTATLLAGCTPTSDISDAEQEFNDSGRAKAIENETDLWAIYEDEITGFSLRYPHNIIPNGLKNDLTVYSQPISSLDYPMGFNEETARQNEAFLSDGVFGIDVDFPLEPSKNLRDLGITFAQEYMVLARFEVCNVTFERTLYFFHNDHQITITLHGLTEEIIESSPEYFTTNETNCGNTPIWDFDKMNQFYKDLVDGNGSSSAQEWFDTFSNIAKTVELHDKNPLALASREMLQGTWISDDDPLSSITFSGRSEQKSYDGQDWLPDTFDLYSSLGPENQNKEGDEGTYLVIWTPEGTMEYAILEISDHKLSLQYLTRGNVLNFTRADD